MPEPRKSYDPPLPWGEGPNPYSVIEGVPQLERVFVPRSPLREYLNRKFPPHNFSNRETFYLNEILLLLQDAIGGDRLYVESNPSLIICDQALGVALDLDYFYLRHLREMVKRQLVRKSGAPPQPFHPLRRHGPKPTQRSLF